MKTSSLVTNFFRKQTDELLLSFEKTVESFTENDFHLVRIDIKRIKALLTLLKEVHPKFNRKKYFSPFKVIFRQAGKIRDLQIQLIMVKANPLNSPIEKFEQELSRQISTEKKKLSILIKPSLIRDLRRKTSTLTDYLSHIRGKAVKRYLKKKEKTIHQLLSPVELKPSGIHELRKRIKELYYLQKMMEPKNIRVINTDQFQELLGKWHDGRVFLQGLKTFMKSRTLPQEDISTFELLKRKMTIDDQQLYQNILQDKADVLVGLT